MLLLKTDKAPQEIAPGTRALSAGSGEFAGKLVSGVLGDNVAHHDYSYLGTSSIQSLPAAPKRCCTQAAPTAGTRSSTVYRSR